MCYSLPPMSTELFKAILQIPALGRKQALSPYSGRILAYVDKPDPDTIRLLTILTLEGPVPQNSTGLTWLILCYTSPQHQYNTNPQSVRKTYFLWPDTWTLDFLFNHLLQFLLFFICNIYKYNQNTNLDFYSLFHYQTSTYLSKILPKYAKNAKIFNRLIKNTINHPSGLFHLCPLSPIYLNISWTFPALSI